MFDLDKILNDIIYSKTVTNIFGNPIYVSIIIVVIILIIILFMFKEVDDEDDYEENFWKKLVKVGIYMIIPIMAIIVVHYKNLEKEMEGKYENKATDKIVNETIASDDKPALENIESTETNVPVPPLTN